MSRVLVLPISAYFAYTGYVIITEPSTFNKQFDKSVQGFPSVLATHATQHFHNAQSMKILGGLLVFISVLTLLGLRPLLKLISLLQLGLIGVFIAGIVERKLEMQQLSEALERIAYHLVLAGMVLVAGSFDSVQEVKEEKKPKKDKKKKVAASEEEESEEKPAPKKEKETKKQEPKQEKKDKKKKE